MIPIGEHVPPQGIVTSAGLNQDGRCVTWAV